MSDVLLQEGDRCPKCEGTMKLEPVEDCRCHICPPCSGCVEQGVYCDICGFSSKEEE